jgi:hypothetical protein
MILLTIYAALSIWQIEIYVFMSLGFPECYEIIMQLRVAFLQFRICNCFTFDTRE